MITKVYTNKTVLAASRDRMAYIFDNFENIIVSVSGGKDSTVLAHLALTEAKKRNRKIGIFFLDEEAVYDSTIQQVEYLMNIYPENTNQLWLQIEFNLTNATSLREGMLKCWEEGKEEIWMRPKRAGSIHTPPWTPGKQIVRNKRVGLEFYGVLDNFNRTYHNTAILLGIRSMESLNRWNAVSRNPGFQNICWCTKQTNGNITFYPLYDWGFQDVWKYIYDHKLRYSKIYDYMFQKGMNIQDMRVSSLIHEKSFKALVELPEFEPETYNKLLKRVSGISVANLYGKDKVMFRTNKLPAKFKNWIEYRDFLLATYPDKSKLDIFVKRFGKHLNNNYVARQQCQQLILNDYENNIPVINKPEPKKKTMEKWRKLL